MPALVGDAQEQDRRCGWVDIDSVKREFRPGIKFSQRKEINGQESPSLAFAVQIILVYRNFKAVHSHVEGFLNGQRSIWRLVHGSTNPDFVMAGR